MDRFTRRKKKRRKRILKGMIFAVLFLLFCTFSYGAYLTYKFAETADRAHHTLNRGQQSALRKEPVNPGEDSVSILFIGVDQRPGEKTPSRSDALILATFNKDHHTIKMVSIPRDSKVEIIDPTGQKDYGLDKIAHAHAFGEARGNLGIDFTVATVEHLFDVPVDYYVRLNFTAFIEIIDAIGGITVNVPVKLVTENSKGENGAIVLQPGRQTLNGEEALAYARNRKSPGSGGDLGRGKRQMEIIQAVIKKSKQIKSITKYDDMMNALHGQLTTNLTPGNLLALKDYAGSIKRIEKLQLDHGHNENNGIFYYILDEEHVAEISRKLKRHLELAE